MSTDSKSKEIDAKDLLTISSEHRLRYPSIEKFTFPTKFVPLTRTEAVAIMNYQETRYNERPKLYQKDIKTLNDLEARLDEVIATHFPGGAFMRLCGRSPKDAEPLNREKIREKYQDALKALANPDSTEEPDAMTKYRAIAKVNYLGVNNGKEAMSLLLTSERVFTDLHDWIKWGEPDQVVLRQWEPELSLEYEFRGYVHKGKLNALSQYDHYGVHPDLEGMKDKIQAMVFAKWQEVHPYVGTDSYLPSSDKLTVVELSPFLQCTGPAMFKWDKDGEQMRNGPFSFRLNTICHPHLEELVHANWELRWARDVPKYWDFYSKAKPDETSSGGGITQLFRNLLTTPTKPTSKLFVYGTLRKGYHWNSKFLSASQKLCDAKTSEKYPLVVGKSFVPYLLGDLPNTGHQITGEVWEVDEVTLKNLDERRYEGIGKGYYSRRNIPVVSSNGTRMEADAYFKTESSAELRESPYLEEYTMEFHKKNYNAIMHIMVKQQLYLGDLSWGAST